jgi:ribosomal protein S18 acetylase RimI-like enzyme
MFQKITNPRNPGPEPLASQLPYPFDLAVNKEESTASYSPGVSAGIITLTSPCHSDEALFYRTYAGTRLEEMALTGWDAKQQDLFLRMQYEAQRQSYLVQVPAAEYWVIRLDGHPAGRLITNRTTEDIHIVDIAVLPEFRRQGIASNLMNSMLAEARLAGKTVSLHVERFNPALSWYERLGFNLLHAGPIYLEMVWRPISATSVAHLSERAEAANHGTSFD